MECAGAPDFLDTGVIIGHLVLRDVHSKPVRLYFEEASIKRFSSERVFAEAKRVLDRSRGVITAFLNELEAQAGSRVRRSADYSQAILSACENHIRSRSLDGREASQLRGFVRVRMDDLRNAMLGQSGVLEQVRTQVALEIATAGNNLVMIFDTTKGVAELFRPGLFERRDGLRAELVRIISNYNDVEILIDAGQLAEERRFRVIRFVTTDRRDIGDRSALIQGIIKTLAVWCLN